MRLGIVTDTHLCPAGTPPDGCHNPYAYDRAADHLRAALDAHRLDNVDVLGVLGDLTNGGDRASMLRALEIIRAAPAPVRVVAGNHDRDVEPMLLADLVKAMSIGMATPAGEIIAGVRIAGLQIAAALDGGWSVVAPAASAWGDEPVVVLSHVPILSRESAVRAADLRYAGGLSNGEGVINALLARTAPTIVIHGHLHLRDAHVLGSVLQIGCASLIEPPYERAVVEVDEGEGRLTITVAHRSVAPVPDVRLPVMAPADASWTFKSGQWTPTLASAT
jgi:predicted phosphodiesterase